MPNMEVSHMTKLACSFFVPKQKRPRGAATKFKFSITLLVFNVQQKKKEGNKSVRVRVIADDHFSLLSWH